MLATEAMRRAIRAEVAQREAVSRRVKRLCGAWGDMDRQLTLSQYEASGGRGLCVLPDGHGKAHVLELAVALSPWQRARLEHFRQR